MLVVDRRIRVWPRIQLPDGVPQSCARSCDRHEGAEMLLERYHVTSCQITRCVKGAAHVVLATAYIYQCIFFREKSSNFTLFSTRSV